MLFIFQTVFSTMRKDQWRAMWVKKKSPREIRRETLEANRARGKLGEDLYKMNATMRGYEYRRTGKGSDFEERRVTFLGKPQRWRKIDVKTGKAQLSDLQRKNGAKVVRMPTYGLDSVVGNFKL